MIRKTTTAVSLSVLILAVACKSTQPKMNEEKKELVSAKKEVVYQVFTRLFGNKKTTNKPWGTIEENGAGNLMTLQL